MGAMASAQSWCPSRFREGSFGSFCRRLGTCCEPSNVRGAVMIASLEPEAPPSSLPLSSPRAPYAAIFADYDSCFDVVNPLIQDCPGTQKYSRAFFQHWGVLEKRDAAVSLLNRFLDEITRD